MDGDTLGAGGREKEAETQKTFSDKQEHPYSEPSDKLSSSSLQLVRVRTLKERRRRGWAVSAEHDAFSRRAPERTWFFFPRGSSWREDKRRLKFWQKWKCDRLVTVNTNHILQSPTNWVTSEFKKIKSTFTPTHHTAEDAHSRYSKDAGTHAWCLLHFKRMNVKTQINLLVPLRAHWHCASFLRKMFQFNCTTKRCCQIRVYSFIREGKSTAYITRPSTIKQQWSAQDLV